MENTENFLKILNTEKTIFFKMFWPQWVFVATRGLSVVPARRRPSSCGA